MQPQMPGEFGSIFMIVMVLSIALVSLALVVLMLVAYCKICAKAGYSWALGLLTLIPPGNIIVPLFLAFADWPVHRELRQLRQQCGTARA